MKVGSHTNTLVEGYVDLLDNLSTDNKLELISKLTDSVKSDLSEKKSSMRKAFGAFDSRKSAEEIIAGLRASRTFTRKIAEL